jgi:hypothetical protein
LRALHPKSRNKYRIGELKKHVNELKTDMLKFPVGYNDKEIRKFEEANNLRINIFYIGKEMYKIYPLYINNNQNTQAIDLRYINTDSGSHYVLINKLEWLLFPGEKHKLYICRRGMCAKTSEEKLKKHEEIC